MSRRTGGLTAVCVIAIVVGVLGLLSGLSRVVGLAVGDKMQTAVFAIQPQINPGMQVGVWYRTQPAVKALFAPAAPSGPQWS
jgi:hypothetical protein